MSASSSSFKSKGKILAWRETTQIRSVLANRDARQLSLLKDFLNLPAYRTVLAMSGAFSWENYLRRVFQLAVITAADLVVKITHCDKTLPVLSWADDQFRTVSRLVQHNLREHVVGAAKINQMILDKFVLGPICNTYGLDIYGCLRSFNKAKFEEIVVPLLPKGTSEEYEEILEIEDEPDREFLLVDFIHRLFSRFRTGEVEIDLPSQLPTEPPLDYYTASQAMDLDQLDKPVAYGTPRQLKGLQGMFGNGYTQGYGALSFYFATMPCFDVFTIIGSQKIAVDVSTVPVTKLQSIVKTKHVPALVAKADPGPSTSTTSQPAGDCNHNGRCAEIGTMGVLKTQTVQQRLAQVLTHPDAQTTFHSLTKKEKMKIRDAVSEGGKFCEVYERACKACSKVSGDIQQQVVSAIIAIGTGSQFTIGAGEIIMN